MARELLADREAQPVAVPEYLTYLKDPIISNVLADDDNSPMANAARILAREVKFWRSQPLFTAPPAPAVLDERVAFNAWNNEDNLPIAGVPAKNAAWLAWQARAMLAQPVSQGSNSPVIPDGWKLVPVDATRAMIDAAMNCDDVEFNSDETFCVNFDNIYRAMLAAVPEGGN
jgi:hypothetical protein